MPSAWILFLNAILHKKKNGSLEKQLSSIQVLGSEKYMMSLDILLSQKTRKCSNTNGVKVEKTQNYLEGVPTGQIWDNYIGNELQKNSMNPQWYPAVQKTVS